MQIFEGEFLITGGVDFGIKFYDLGQLSRRNQMHSHAYDIKLVSEKTAKIFVEAIAVLGENDETIQNS